MACINLFNTEHQGGLGPRMSFSNDFSVEPPAQPPLSQRLPVTDPDFEFSVSSHSMIAADQLFSKGRILPLKDSTGRPFCGTHRPATTLRNELRANGDDVDRGSNKGPTAPRWKEFLGFKKERKGSSENINVELHAGNITQQDQ